MLLANIYEHISNFPLIKAVMEEHFLFQIAGSVMIKNHDIQSNA